MKVFSYLSILFLLLAICLACKDADQPSVIPVCIEQKIDLFEQEACDAGANVTQYLFQGEEVYVFDIGSCGADFVYPVLSADCDTLYFLGGLIGNINCKEVIFADEATATKVVWSN